MSAIAEPIVVEPTDTEPGEIHLSNCSWCGGSGYWNGHPCIQCNPQQGDGEDDCLTITRRPSA